MTPPPVSTPPAPLTIVVPLPDPLLSPNARAAWALRARAKRQARTDACHAALAALPPGRRYGYPWFGAQWRVWVSIQVTWGHNGPTPDADNLIASLKATFDGLTDAGVWADDKQLMIGAIESTVVRRQPWEEPGALTLTLTAVEERSR